MPLHFIWGDEDYLIEKEIKRLKKEVLGDNYDALNFRSLDNPDFATFDEALRTSPMFFGDVLYLIKCDKYFLETKSKIKLEDDQISALCDSFKSVSDRIHVILLCPIAKGETKKPDSRKKIYKELAKVAQIKHFPSFKAYEDYKIAPVLIELAKEKKLTLKTDTACLLVQICGPSIRVLDSQLEKIKLSIYPQENVTPQNIRDICLAGEDIFTLPDLILRKDYTQALEQISKIIQKSHYLEVLSFLQTSFSNLLKIKVFSNSLSPYEISQKVGQHEFVVKKNLEKLAKVPFEDVLNFKLNLLEAEFLLKTSQSDPILAFSKAMFGGCNDCR